MAERRLTRAGRRVWHAVPSAGARTAPAAKTELTCALLDDAIESARRTGEAAERLSQTLAAFHAWTLQQLEATQPATGA